MLTGFSVLTVLGIIMIPVSSVFETQFAALAKTNETKIVDPDEDAFYHESDWDEDDALYEYEKLLCEEMESEGATLLKNENNALPLDKGSRVSLFSQSSVDMIYGGTGSGAVDTDEAPTLCEALTENGFEVNPTLTEFYENSSYSRSGSAVIGGNTADYMIGEVPVNGYTQEVKSSFSDYGDAAIIVLSRSGGEGADLPYGEGVLGCEEGASDAENGDYLVLNQDEKDLLEMVCDYKEQGVFGKVVVLLNSANAVQLDFIDGYDIDSILWIGDVGQTGLYGVAKLLSGEYNPSGRLVDTFLNDNHSAPAMQNFGVYEYSNSDELSLASAQNNVELLNVQKLNSRYVVYEEGIYVGYRYYETRYEDYVMGAGNAGSYSYENEVRYPFGYGLSYGEGEYEYSDFTLTDEGDSLNVKVDVTNNTGVDGKHTVEIYMQSPFTDYDVNNHIEKSSVELCGFDKLEIRADETKTFSIDIDKSELASYDSYNAKTYIVDEGDYLFTAAHDAHEAVNNFLAHKGYTPDSTFSRMDAEGDSASVGMYTQDEFDSTTFSVSDTGAPITNRFDNADINFYKGTDRSVTYLTRSDWEGTSPETFTDFEVTEQMWHDGLAPDLKSISYPNSGKTGHDERLALIEEYEDAFWPNADEVPETEADYGLQLIDLMGVDYDDPRWNQLISQASYEDMTNLIYNAFHLTHSISSIGLPGTINENGPQGYTASVIMGSSAMCYPSEDVMSATFNLDLISEMGKCIAEDCIRNDTHGLYGPGLNMHRTPYSGRNFEYYSEDPFLSGKVAAVETEAIQSKGVFVYLKHFALNDQENGRYGISTFANEQSIREIYLRPFQDAVEEGGALSVMTSLNRVGVVWSGAHHGLLTSVLRDEWGMEGSAITDCTMFSTAYDYRLGVLAGQNLWDGYVTLPSTRQLDGLEDDPAIVAAVQESTKKICISVINSHAMNTIGSLSSVEYRLVWWQWLIYICIGLIFALELFSLVMFVIRRRQWTAGDALLISDLDKEIKKSGR